MFHIFERELTRVPRATDRVTLGARSHKHGVWRGSQQPPALLEAFDMIIMVGPVAEIQLLVTSERIFQTQKC